MRMQTRQISPLPICMVAQRWVHPKIASLISTRAVSNITTRFPISVPCSTNLPIKKRTESINLSARAISTHWETCQGIWCPVTFRNGAAAKLNLICIVRLKSATTLNCRAGVATSKSSTIMSLHMSFTLNRHRKIVLTMKKSKRNSMANSHSWPNHCKIASTSIRIPSRVTCGTRMRSNAILAIWAKMILMKPMLSKSCVHGGSTTLKSSMAISLLLREIKHWKEWTSRSSLTLLAI